MTEEELFAEIHEEMNRCINCNEKYEPREDENGMLPTENDCDYMCKPCSTDTSIKRTDYRKETVCMNPKCGCVIWELKSQNHTPDHPLFCPDCLMLFYGMRANGKIENDLSKFYELVNKGTE